MTIPSTLPRFLWHFVKRFKMEFLGFVFVSVFWAANLSLSPYAMKLILDGIADTDTSELFVKLLPSVCLYLSLNFLLGLIFRLYDWLEIRTFPKMRSAITEEMFSYIEGHSYSYFQQNFSGSLGNKINDMARSACLVISNIIDDFFARILSLFIGALTMFFVSPSFALLLIGWMTVFFCVSFFLSKKGQRYSEIFSESRSSVVGKVVDSVSNILNVKLFARRGFEKKYLKTYLEDSAKKDETGLWYLLKVKTFYAISITLLTGAMLALLIYERSVDHISVGDFALILTLNMFLIEEVFFLADQLVPFSEEVGTCQQALSLISQAHDILDKKNATTLNVPKGEIVFENVNFHYKEGVEVFENQSITIKPGEKVGLVGTSGSGKSTFVNLIIRFFDVTGGRILIDGQDIRDVTQESLREAIAMIPQEPILFHRSLLENLRYSKLNASLEEVIDCSKKAHCHEFIETMPQKYEALVGERGVKLSGGQRQRIAIARAFLKNAPILILDEATSALDSLTEKKVESSLSALMEGKTTLVIAHRLSTLFHMDRILVFHEGSIIEEGSHSELIALRGQYAKLWAMQSGGLLTPSIN